MRHTLSILFLMLLFAACGNDAKPVKEVKTKAESKPERVFETIEEVKPFTEFRAFWNYYTSNIKLNEDFLGYDKKHERISKTKFLNLLATGNYQPVVINPTDSIRYQLKPSPPKADGFISDYMKKFAREQLVFYHREGRPLPEFSFKTITGVKYTSENTKGKVLLIKCWFVACVPCAQEMPELNEMVESYGNRKDIIFLSLATDDEGPVKGFLKKTKFTYQTVARQGSYMTNKLNVTAYPTHFLVNKKGQLYKVANDVAEVKVFLERILKEGNM